MMEQNKEHTTQDNKTAMQALMQITKDPSRYCCDEHTNKGEQLGV